MMKNDDGWRGWRSIVPEGGWKICAHGRMDKMPDSEGSGPFPATYDMAPGGIEYVVYQPKDLTAAARVRSLVFIFGERCMQQQWSHCQVPSHRNRVPRIRCHRARPISGGPKAKTPSQQGSAASGGGQDAAGIAASMLGEVQQPRK